MFSTKATKAPLNVTLTRLRDVNCFASRPYLTANIRTTFLPISTQRPHKLSLQILKPRSVHIINMSNNADLKTSQVFDVKGKVALVTGGGSGIGLMIAQTLAVNGVKVYIAGRTEEKLQRVVDAHGQGIEGAINPIVADVSTKDGVE